MIALLQRVSSGQVKIKDKIISQIGKGYVILLGIFEKDTEDDLKKLVDKIANLRVMADDKDKMNLSIKDVKGDILVVSQFTLCADLTFGRRPSFLDAKKPEEAEKIYLQFVEELKKQGIPVKTGKFGEYMKVTIVNDGPVTIIIDSKKN